MAYLALTAANLFLREPLALVKSHSTVEETMFCYNNRLKALCLLGILGVTFLGSMVSVAVEETKTGLTHPTGTNREALPALSQVIPSAIRLDEQYARLTEQLKEFSDLSLTKEKLAHLSDRVNGFSKQWLTLKTNKESNFDQLSDLKLELAEKTDSLNRVSETLIDKLEKVDRWKREWLRENDKWAKWDMVVKKDMALDPVKNSVTKARQTIDIAVKLIDKELQPLLATQQEIGNIQSRIRLLDAEIKSRFVKGWGTDTQEYDPLFFSPSYFFQLTSKELWLKMLTAFSSISWPKQDFFVKHGWVILSQVLLALILSISIFRHRDSLEKSEQWVFFSSRPFSVGTIIGILTFFPFYSFKSLSWNLILSLATVIAFLRLVGGVVSEGRKRRLIFCMAVFFILTIFFRMINLPMPFFRLYIFFAALTGLSFSFWNGVARPGREDSTFYTWSLRAGAVLFLVILIANVGGHSSFATRLFGLSLGTAFLFLVYMMLILLAKGVLEFIVNSMPVQKFPIIRNKTPGIIAQSSRALNLVLGFFLVAVILSAWGIYASPAAAVEGLLSLGFAIGSQNITLALVITAAVLLYGSYITSWTIQALLLDEILPRRQMDRGIQISITRLLHYALVFLGFILALMALGLELTNLTILGGAFGIGVGFGLQAIVNNFASGLILLFERPVKIGDTIELGEQWGVIKKLGLRATIVQTYDNAEIVVPNSDLISNQVTNWTLAERRVRIKINVGVAYGSDVSLVMKILMECAEEHALILKDPAPQVLFMGFGDSSLDFELRVWVADFADRRIVPSDMHQAIDRKFRQSNIEIPFPQRDLHVRSLDEAVSSSLKNKESRS